jgi:1,4-alpha-glucan branching enzyme
MVKKKYFKTKQECEVTFELDADAERVDLVCEANGWQPIAMKKAGKAKTGPFRAKVRLPQEREYEFRYLVDRRSWVNDESADAVRPNEYGGENSVLSTRPGA